MGLQFNRCGCCDYGCLGLLAGLAVGIDSKVRVDLWIHGGMFPRQHAFCLGAARVQRANRIPRPARHLRITRVLASFSRGRASAKNRSGRGLPGKFADVVSPLSSVSTRATWSGTRSNCALACSPKHRYCSFQHSCRLARRSHWQPPRFATLYGIAVGGTSSGVVA